MIFAKITIFIIDDVNHAFQLQLSADRGAAETKYYHQPYYHHQPYLISSPGSAIRL